MKKRLLLIKFQIKECIKTTPTAFAVMLITTMTVFLAAYMAMIAGKNDTDGKVKVALVVNDDNIYVNAAINYLFEDEKVRELCEFTRTDMKTAAEMLLNGEKQAVVLIPEGFFDGIMNGGHVSPKVILKKTGQISSLAYFQEMISAGAKSLAIAQAAIYAADDICRTLAPEKYNETENYLNRTLMLTVLRRDTLFKTQIVSPTGNVTLAGFYIAGAVMAVILYSMTACCGLFCVNDKNRKVILDMSGLHCIEDVFIKYMGNTFFYFTFFAVLYVIYVIFSGGTVSVGNLGKILLLVSGFVAFMMFFSSLSNTKSAASFVCICAVLFFLVLSGNIVPLSFMPEAVRKFGNIFAFRNYTLLLADVLGSVMPQVSNKGAYVSPTNVLIVSALWNVSFLAATTAICNLKNRMESFGK